MREKVRMLSNQMQHKAQYINIFEALEDVCQSPIYALHDRAGLDAVLDVDHSIRTIVMCLELDMLQNERLTMDVIRLLSLLTNFVRSDTVYPNQGERSLIVVAV